MDKDAGDDTDASEQTPVSAQPLISNASFHRPRSGSYTHSIPTHDTGLARRSSSGSSHSRVARRSSVSQLPMPPSFSVNSTTHVGGVQPPTGFFRPSHPNPLSPRLESDKPMPMLLEASMSVETNQATHMGDEGSHMDRQANDSRHSLSMTNIEAPTREPTPSSTIDSRRRPARLQMS